MKKIYVIFLIGIASLKGYAQTPATSTTNQVVAPVLPEPVKDWGVSFYGFIRTDYIWDTRKCAQVREEQLNLYPLDEVLDANGKDINAVGQSNFLSITSRLGVKVKGPDVWGAKISGTVEGDFFGNTETATTSTIGLFRLRHAYVSMDWSQTSLTMGQTWYPTFIPEVFPGVENFNTGILFNVFGWATQVKLKQNFTKELSGTLTAFKEREFTAPGPGSQNSASINSALPSLNAQVQYKGKNMFLGAGFEYKSMQPLTVSTTNLVTTEKVTSSSIFGYAKYSNDKIIIKAYGISGGNMNNLVMLGGFTGTTNTAGIQSYDPTKTTSFWFDIASNGKSIAPGLFIGTTKNNGANTAANVLNSIYMRGLTGSRVVDNVWRVSGRVDFKKNKFRISPEIEYTVATWGDTDLYGKATTNKKDVANLRTMISCVYSF
jgi:hypothetical protein